MRRLLIGLLAVAASACGGSDDAADAPPATQPASAPARAPRPPAFPGPDRLRLGDAVSLRRSGAPAEACNKLHLGDEVVGVVRTFVHAGRGAMVLRCSADAWAQPSAPTRAELQGVGATLDGRLAPEYEGIVVAADSTLTFVALDLAGRASDVSAAGRWAAYVMLQNDRDAAGGGREADAIGIVYDIPGRFAVQQYLLGTCRGSTAFATPSWASDGRSLVFHGDGDRCSFEEVEAHPE
jgi:hypothetical protein